jgi:PadR family transcriptional regulator, regulatory protein PadR
MMNTSLPGIEVFVIERPRGPNLFARSPVEYAAYLYMTKLVLDRSALDAAKKGSADLFILALLDKDDHHGYEIGRQIETRSGGDVRFTMASLYATLYRLEERALVKGRWVEKAGQRRRRYYRITDSGRAMLATQREDWARFMTALTLVAGVKPA